MSKVLESKTTRTVWALVSNQFGASITELFETKVDAITAKGYRNRDSILIPMEVHSAQLISLDPSGNDVNSRF